MRLLAIFFGCIAAAATLPAQPYTPGQTYFGTSDYVEYQAGNCPIVVTAPHGGSLRPDSIPDRENGTYNGVTYTNIVTTIDANTQDLARKVAQEIFNRSGRRPHLIISRLHRIKLDPNREIGEAALGNAEAETAWTEYHNFIRAARQAAETQFGFAFLTDLHGHGHAIQRLELGYNYDPELDLSDAALTHPGYAYKGSLHTLTLRRAGVPFPTILRGSGSLGDLFNRLNVPAWPSPEFPTPGDNDFFDGGHTTRIQTCIDDNGLTNGVQIEAYNVGLRDTDSNRATFATVIARALHIFLYKQFGYELGAYSQTSFVRPVNPTLARGGSPLTLTATRTGNLSLSTTLVLNFGGTAVAGTDYTASASSLFFPANQSTATLTLTPAANPNTGGDRTITVAFSPSWSQTARTEPVSLTLGDGSSQTVRVTALAETVRESDPAAVLRFTRTSGSTALTVPLTWSGSALAEADYHDAPAAVHFPSGVTSVDVVVPLVDDARAEPDKVLTVSLANGAGYIAGVPATASVTIRDDDRPANLVAWLRGELAGNIARDSSGHERHATSLPADSDLSSGPVATVANGAPAFEFDGVDDTIVLPRFTADPAGEFTVAFFFRLQSLATVTNQCLLSYGTRGSLGGLHVALSSTTALRTFLSNRTSSTLDITLASNWQDNVWRHYALSVGADGTARVYLNGVLQRTSTGATFSLTPNELFWLGWRSSRGGSSNAFMRGALRDFRVYQRALGVAEITALSNQVQTYAAWLAQNGLPAATAPGSDADADSFPALVEYGLNANANASDIPPRYSVGIENARLTLRFLRETNAADLSWHIEASTDLGTWQTLASRTAAASQWTIHVGGAAVSELNGYVTATDAMTAVPARFLRLRITR